MEDATYIDIFERLKVATGATSDQELAVKLGLSKQSIADARSRKTVPPAWIPKAAQLFGVSTDWLFFGTQAKGELIDAEPVRCCDVELKLVPMAEARLSAGNGSLEVSSDHERSYAFRMDFLLEILDGDVVLLDQGRKDIIPGRIFAVGFEEAIYLKRIDMVPGKVILKSVNEEAYPPIELDIRGDMAEYFRVIGKVVWSGREYR